MRYSKGQDAAEAYLRRPTGGGQDTADPSCVAAGDCGTVARVRQGVQVLYDGGEEDGASAGEYDIGRFAYECQ